jgi:hypothetical protein
MSRTSMFLVSLYIGCAVKSLRLYPCNVSGTSNIYEQDDDRSDHADTTGLKHDWTTKEPTILVPQPSDDPNDPLVCEIAIQRIHISNYTLTLMRFCDTRIGHYGGVT